MRRSSAAAALLVAVAAAPARADNRFEIGGFAGSHLFNDDNEIGVDDLPDADSPASSVVFGVRVGYAFHRLLSLEGEIAVAPTETRQLQTPVTIYGLRAHALAYFTGGRVRPFATLGAGLLISSPRDQNDLRTDADLVSDGGLGLEVAVGERWGVRLDARLLLPASSAGDGVTVDGLLSLGLFRRFHGGRAAAPPADPDPDGDGVRGAADRCPDEAEDRDGFEDGDGCVDADDDGDGIPDLRDACPRQAEDKNGVEDGDGCPEIGRGDGDGDGIRDAVDGCPDEPEDVDGHDDQDGCPDLDDDGDGIPDAKDECPRAPETANGYRDEDGCPDEPPGSPETDGPVAPSDK